MQYNTISVNRNEQGVPKSKVDKKAKMRKNFDNEGNGEQMNSNQV